MTLELPSLSNEFSGQVKVDKDFEVKPRRLDFKDGAGQNVAIVGTETRMSSLAQSVNFMAGLRLRLRIGVGQQQDEKTNCN